MNRQRMIAGNWKMHNGLKDSSEFIRKLEAWLEKDAVGQSVATSVKNGEVEIVIAPAFTSIACAAGTRKTDLIGISAQNAHYEPKGAFTGEVSLEMVQEVGCQYVILGHSERRHIFGEDDVLLEKKLQATLRSPLLPIFCVGEQLAEREAGKMESVLQMQLETAWRTLRGSEVAEKVVIAYEPVWAIGTGKTASNEDAQFACKFIRSLAGEKFGADIAAQLRILYGGSVKPDNSVGLLAQPDIDGLLIGGASLEVESFEKMLASAIRG